MSDEPKVIGTVEIRYHDQSRVDKIPGVYQSSYLGFAQDLEFGQGSTLGAFTLDTAKGERVTVVKARVLRASFKPTGTDNKSRRKRR